MRGPSALVVFLAAVAAAIGFALRPPHPHPPDSPHPRIRLAVLVIFDQMRGDYPERWKPLFGTGGFARLQTEGATFTHCHYPYATTTTGPGHASILSGTCADKHGIINNNWFASGATVYCAGSPSRYEFVPGPTPKGKDVGHPEFLRAETLADVLKSFHKRAKVFGLSLKDRSAILPTGKRPDGAYWFNGQFVTSTYYAERPHIWVNEFNRSKTADRWFGKDWVHFRDDLDYDKWSGPDRVPGEGKGIAVTAKDDPARGWSQKSEFPHPNTGGRDKPGKEYYDSLANSPFGNDLLLEFAKSCIRAEQLGGDDVPDLLVLSFSSNDLIGHTWGPDSQEVLDVTLRSDALMADLLGFLDGQVGKGRYLLAVTADHGVCPLPEVSLSKKLDARRIEPKNLQRDIEDHLTQRFGSPSGATNGDKKPAWVEAQEAQVLPWIYLNPRVCAAAKRSRAEVASAVAEYVSRRPEFARAFTRAELEGPLPPQDRVALAVRRSYYPERSGDVYLLLKRYYVPGLESYGGTGTTHGSPYEYDTHVPFMVIGPGVVGGSRSEPVAPQAIAAIFARWLDIRPPRFAECPVPESLER
jgi:hypothetical protein